MFSELSLRHHYRYPRLPSSSSSSSSLNSDDGEGRSSSAYRHDDDIDDEELLIKRSLLLDEPKEHKHSSLLCRCLVKARNLVFSHPIFFLAGVLFVAVATHRTLSYTSAHKQLVLHPIAWQDRQCPVPEYKTMAQNTPLSGDADTTAKICLTTLTDEKHKALRTRLFGWRNFDGILQLTWPNKVAYAKKHGYYLFDESDQLDPSRPPSWSKIRAVQRLLEEENCAWVFWMDADTVVMNSDRRVEEILPADTSKDLVITAVRVSGYNAGLWMVRNTPWTRQFLQQWWDMSSFVKPTGLSKSGDNDALKYKLKHMEEVEFDGHVVTPAKCNFNSHVQVEPAKTGTAPASDLLDTYEEQEWSSMGGYHRGDFVAHTTGVDNKAQVIRQLLAIAH